MIERASLPEALRRLSPADFPGGVTARGSSMRPAIEDGDRLVVAPPENIREGDIVVFRAGGDIVCHRVREILSDGRLITRGDSAGRDDEPVAPAGILGKVARVERAMPGARASRFALRALKSLAATSALKPFWRLLLPRACRYELETPVPLKSIAAFAPGAPAAAAPGGSRLIARLLGRRLAALDLESGRVEVHPALAGLGLEARLRRWAPPR